MRLVQLYSERAAHIQTVGELFTGELEAAANASGFLVADDLVITNNHAVPPNDGRYKSVRFDVRFASRNGNARFGTVIARDEVRDLALVQVFPAVDPRPYCPVAALGATGLVPQGTRLYALVFPLDEDLNVVDGLVSSKKSDLKWMTNAALHVGTSGGAVFSSKGYLIGLAVGGITEFTNMDGARSPVFGVNYLVPAVSLVGTEIDTAIRERSEANCWNMMTSLPSGTPTLASLLTQILPSLSHVAGAVGGGRAPAGGAAPGAALPTAGTALDEPPLPERLSRSFTISTTKYDHGISRSKRTYKKRLEPAPGYRIESCSFRALSANKESGVGCVVAPDGDAAEFTYSLTSGPLYDRWRGWLHGTVNVRQRKKD